MKVLVTGGAGYLGCILVPMLLQEGYKVHVLDNLMYGGAGLVSCVRHPNFELTVGDIRDRDTLFQVGYGCDTVVHLAAIVGFPACRKDPELADSVNFFGSVELGRTIGRSRPIIFASTGSNYGAVSDGICTEETPLNPLSLYGKVKVRAEEYLQEYCDVVTYRFATAFGLSPRMRLDLLINDFVNQVITQRYLVVYEARFMRTFIHVVDMAKSILFALENLDAMTGKIYNVGSGKLNYSKQQICEAIREQANYYLHYADVDQDADKRDYVMSYDKIAALGFDTTITIEEGIAELIRGLPLFSVRNPYSNV